MKKIEENYDVFQLYFFQMWVIMEGFGEFGPNSPLLNFYFEFPDTILKLLNQID